MSVIKNKVPTSAGLSTVSSSIANAARNAAAKSVLPTAGITSIAAGFANRTGNNNNNDKDDIKKPKNTPTSGNTNNGGLNLVDYYSSLAAQRQAAADAAYENNMARIASMYENVAGNLGSNYDSTVSRLNAARNKSMGEINTDAENSLRQAYINNELTKRGLNQRLSAMGYNGGATESTMANLANEYSRSRGGINTTRNDNLADLEQTYGDNLANALQAYNLAMNNLEMQRMSLENAAENARANASASDISGALTMDSGFITALQNALANQGNYQYDPSQATNDFVAGQAQQAQTASEGNAYAKYMAQQLLAAGNSPTDVNNYLLSQGYSQQTLQDILRQLAS